MNAFVVSAILCGVWIVIAVRLAAREEAAVAKRPTSLAQCASVAVAALVALVALIGPHREATLAVAFAGSALVVAGFADARTGYLFDCVTGPAAVLTLLAVLHAGSGRTAALGVLLLVGVFGSLWFASRGRLMGAGDVKAMFALGAAFGPELGAIAVFGACVSGIATAAAARRFRHGVALRFGPHLAAGYVFAMVAGDAIVREVYGR